MKTFNFFKPMQTIISFLNELWRKTAHLSVNGLLSVVLVFFLSFISTKSYSMVYDSTKSKTVLYGFGSDSSIIFSVQIISLDGLLPRSADFFDDCGTEVNLHIINSKYVYTVGKFLSVDDALELTDRLRASGYEDAFPVIFINEQRIIVDEQYARRLNERF